MQEFRHKTPICAGICLIVQIGQKCLNLSVQFLLGGGPYGPSVIYVDDKKNNDKKQRQKKNKKKRRDPHP